VNSRIAYTLALIFLVIPMIFSIGLVLYRFCQSQPIEATKKAEIYYR